jgi:hypothetical protein
MQLGFLFLLSTVLLSGFMSPRDAMLVALSVNRFSKTIQ